MRKQWQRAAIIAMALIAASAVLVAQSNYGSITGVVKDVSGSSVPNAVVKVTDLGTNAAITVHTDESGVYSLPSLRPVSYSVGVSATGFQSVMVDNVKVDTSNVLGQPSRYANLTPAVWTAILHKDPSSLSGAASTTTLAGGVLSPLGVYQELSGYYNGNLYILDQNGTLSRVIQLGLKFYF